MSAILLSLATFFSTLIGGLFGLRYRDHLNLIMGFTAGVLVILVGALVRVPLAKVPENTLKFVVGIMLTTFGTFWLAEGFNYAWPLSDAFLLILVAIYLGASFLLIAWLKRMKKQQREQAAENQSVPATVQKQEVNP